MWLWLKELERQDVLESAVSRESAQTLRELRELQEAHAARGTVSTHGSTLQVHLAPRPRGSVDPGQPDAHFAPVHGAEAWGRHYMGIAGGVSLGLGTVPSHSFTGFVSGKLSVVESMIFDNVPPYDHSAWFDVPSSLADQLINAYFAYVNSQTPVIDEPYFRTDLRRRLEGAQLQAPDDYLEHAFDGLVLAVFALGARYLRADQKSVKDSWTPIDPHDSMDIDGQIEGAVLVGDTYYRSASVEYSYRAGAKWLQGAVRTKASSRDGYSLYDLQRTALINLYLTTAASPSRTWERCVDALKEAVQVGAHRERHVRWSSDANVNAQRKQAMWLLLYIERTYAYRLGRPLSFESHELDVSPPSDPSRTMDILSGVGTITANVIRTVYSSRNTTEDVRNAIGEINAETRAWLANFPDLIRASSKPDDLGWAPIRGTDLRQELRSLALFAQVWGVRVLAAQAAILSHGDCDMWYHSNESASHQRAQVVRPRLEEAFAECARCTGKLLEVCLRALEIPGGCDMLAVHAMAGAFVSTLVSLAEAAHLASFYAQDTSRIHFTRLLRTLRGYDRVISAMAPL